MAFAKVDNVLRLFLGTEGARTIGQYMKPAFFLLILLDLCKPGIIKNLWSAQIIPSVQEKLCLSPIHRNPALVGEL